MESEKIPGRQSNLEKEEQRCSLFSNYTTKLQLSKLYGTGPKTDTEINGTN